MDELITSILDRGWLFNNCYQVDAGLWRVNLRRPDGEGDWFTDWAEASSLQQALETCLDKMEQAEWIEASPIVLGKDQPLSLTDQMQELINKLAKPTKIERRI